MEYEFEIVYTDTEQMCRKIFNRVYGARCAVYAACMAVFAALVLPDWFRGSAVSGVMGGLFLLGIPWFLTHPALYAKKTFKDRLKYYNGQIPATTARFGDNIYLGDKLTGSTLEYDDIKKIEFLEHIIIFVTFSKKIYATANEGFTKGSLPQLRRFLEEKCTLAKITG